MAEIWVMKIAPEERSDVRSCLGHDEMVNVEQLCDTGEGGVAVSVGCLAPGVECGVCSGGPGDDSASLVFAF